MRVPTATCNSSDSESLAALSFFKFAVTGSASQLPAGLYRKQRAMLRQRVEVIANMNHHLRNALQVIEFNSYSTSDQEKLGAVKSSVNRIQWALRELLPKL